MNKYEVRYQTNGGWVSYVIYRNGQPVKGGELRTSRAAIRDAQRELEKLQRAEQQPLAA